MTEFGVCTSSADSGQRLPCGQVLGRAVAMAAVIMCALLAGVALTATDTGTRTVPVVVGAEPVALGDSAPGL